MKVQPLCLTKGRTRPAVSGPLSLSHHDAELLALQAGAQVTDRVSREVDVVVHRGGRRGRRTGKLEQAERLVRAGHKLHIIGEGEFRRLARRELA